MSLSDQLRGVPLTDALLRRCHRIQLCAVLSSLITAGASCGSHLGVDGFDSSVVASLRHKAGISEAVVGNSVYKFCLLCICLLNQSLCTVRYRQCLPSRVAMCS